MSENVALKNIVTPDDMMEEFVSDMMIADDELSDSIFTCVDNYIDNLCIEMMNDDKSVFENDTDVDTPFTYIIDKVLEKIDTIEEIEADSYVKALSSAFSDNNTNDTDPDYCEGIDFDNIDPEDFQLYIPKTIQNDESEEKDYYMRSVYDGFEDANFNA